LTRDHTLAERLLDEGINPDNDHLLVQLRNVLMRALGADGGECRADVQDYLLENGDQLLPCTDGLTEMVDAEIESVLIKEESAHAACRKLVDQALDNGGRDNVTVIVARYTIPQR